MSAYNVPIPNPGNIPFNSSEWTANNYTSIPVSGGIMTGNLTLPSINITNATQSTAYTNGSLVCSGGVGIAKDIFTNGKLTITGALAGCTTINSSGINTLTNTTASSAYTNGSLITAGGIGVAKDLHINGIINMQANAGDRKLGLFSLGSTDYYGFGANSAAVLYMSAFDHTFYTGSTPLSKGTQVGILDRNGKLTLTGGLAIVGSITGATTINSSGINTLTSNTASTNTSTGSLVVSGGVGVSGAINCSTAGIGAVSTGYPLQLGFTTQTIATSYGYINSSGTTGTGSNTGAQNFSMYANGRIACTGEIELVSDRKLKENIIDITDEEAELFFNINPKKYNKIGFENKEFGYISQDIGKVIPELINIIKDEGQSEYIDEDGFISPADHIITVNYQKIICLLHRKMQLMEKKINKIYNV